MNTCTWLVQSLDEETQKRISQKLPQYDYRKDGEGFGFWRCPFGLILFLNQEGLNFVIYSQQGTNEMKMWPRQRFLSR